MLTLRSGLIGALLGTAFLLCGVGSELAYAQDPFDIIFGDGNKGVTGSPSETAHEDNIRLVSFWLRDFLLIDAATAFETANGLCLQATPVFEALKLPLSIENDQLEGWVGQKSRSVDYSFHSQTGMFDGRAVDSNDIQATELSQGWCLSLQTLTDLTDIDFEYRENILSVVATPRTVLPLEAKLERARIREGQLGESLEIRPSFPKISAPYSWFSYPTADVTVDMDTRNPSGLKPTVTFEASGDFLKSTARLRSVAGQDGGQSIRMTVGRTSETDDQLGLLKARHFSVGHVSTSGTPLTRRPQTGLGVVVSNSPEYEPALFDETDLRGPLPAGWEAELYQDNRIIDFTDQPDSNGDYVFANVPLTPGYNRFTVRLFGPYGEEKEEVFARFVGQNQRSDGEWRYTVSVVQPDKLQLRAAPKSIPVFGQENIEMEQTEVEAKPRISATIEHGLTKRLSVRVDGEVESDGVKAVAASLQGAFNHVHGGVRIASDGSGRPAVEVYSQAQLSEKSSMSVRLTDFGDLQSDYSGYGQGRVIRKAQLRFDTRLGRSLGFLPLRSQLNVEETESGEKSLSLSNIASSNFRGVNWNHNAVYTASGGSSALEGGLILSRSLGGTRFRAGLGYSVRDKFSLNGLSMSAQRNVWKDTRLQVSSAYDMTSKSFGGEAALTKFFDKFTISTRGGLSQNGDWYGGLNLAFALYKPEDDWRYHIAQPGLSRMGSIRFLSYADADIDGEFDADETAVSGLKFIIDNSLRSNLSDENGINLISGIETNKAITVEPQLSSIDDPFLVPADLGYELSVRPGQLMTVYVPLRPTGDIDGTVVLKRGEHLTPLASVTVEFVSGSGVVIKQVKTEYDGYFYADSLPIGAVSVRIANESLELIKARSETISVQLTHDQPSMSGARLVMISEG
ncbi:MAG: hypothetical protein AAFP97_02680 [Pseudomonadota bacterium]